MNSSFEYKIEQYPFQHRADIGGEKEIKERGGREEREEMVVEVGGERGRLSCALERDEA